MYLQLSKSGLGATLFLFGPAGAADSTEPKPPGDGKDLVGPIVFQAAGPPPTRFSPRSMRSARRWESPITAMNQGRSTTGAARLTGTAAAGSTRRQTRLRHSTCF